jgi:hypothetical protein
MLRIIVIICASALAAAPVAAQGGPPFDVRDGAWALYLAVASKTSALAIAEVAEFDGFDKCQKARDSIQIHAGVDVITPVGICVLKKSKH